jgi:hypothetical protein
MLFKSRSGHRHQHLTTYCESEASIYRAHPKHWLLGATLALEQGAVEEFRHISIYMYVCFTLCLRNILVVDHTTR